MANQIKIGVDVNSIKRSIFDISASIDRSFGKGKSFEIFSKDTKKFLLEQASQAIQEMKKEMESLAKESEKYRKELERANQSEEESLALKNKILKIEKDRAKFQTDISKLEEGKKVIESGSLGMAGKALSKIPGIGPLLGKLMRGGVGMGGALLGGAGLLGGFAFSRAMQGWGAFSSAAPDRLSLRGRGVTDVTGYTDRLGRGGLGYSPTDVRAAQQQGIGIFGLESSQTASPQLLQRMRFARRTGMSPEAIQGMFSGVQAQTGFGGANKAFEEFRATIVADKLEHALAPYMEATNSLLANINENGLALTGDAIRSLATIAGRGDLISAQQAARLITSIDASIKGSSGDTRAFFMQAFAGQGIGGGLLGGAEAATQMGLFGGSEEALERYQKAGLITDKGFIGDMKAMGLVGQTAAKQRASAIKTALDQISARFPGEEALPEGASTEEKNRARQQKRLGRGFMLMSLIGGSDITESEARYGALQKMAAAKSPEEYARQAKEYEEKFGEKSLEQIMSSAEGRLAKIESYTQKTQESLGEAISKTMIDIKTILAEIDNILANTLGPLAKLVEFTGTGVGEGAGFLWSKLMGYGDTGLPARPDVYDPKTFANIESMGTRERAGLVSDARDELKTLTMRRDEAIRSGESTNSYDALIDKLTRMITLAEEAAARENENIRIQQMNQKHLSTLSGKAANPKADKNARKSTLRK